MIKTSAAYGKLATILGSQIKSRRRTLKVAGQPVQVFSETLLLIPENTATVLHMDGELYVDRKSNERFSAVVVSQTSPRPKNKVAAAPRNPLMGWRAFIGQAVYHDEDGEGYVTGPTPISTATIERLLDAKVRTTSYSVVSDLRFHTVCSQYDLLMENQRIHDIKLAINAAGGDSSRISYLSAVAATEEDAVRLLERNAEDDTTFMRLTAPDEHGISTGRVFQPDDEENEI